MFVGYFSRARGSGGLGFIAFVMHALGQWRHLDDLEVAVRRDQWHVVVWSLLLLLVTAVARASGGLARMRVVGGDLVAVGVVVLVGCVDGCGVDIARLAAH